ncbi:MAG: host attachment protein [Myxococcota bacterium]
MGLARALTHMEPAEREARFLTVQVWDDRERVARRIMAADLLAAPVLAAHRPSLWSARGVITCSGMARTWIVVGHGAGLRILESRGPGTEMRTVRDVPFPWAALKERDAVTDKAGRRFHPGQQGERRSTMENPDPIEHNVIRFAKEMAGAIDKDRAAGKFDRLVLVCEPKFLGRLREELSDATTRLIEATLAKDLADADAARVRRSLEDQILV